MLSSSSITDSAASVGVRTEGDSSYLGGLVGYLNASSVAHSYATGSVYGYDYFGGLVGYMYSTSSIVTDSYATGSINIAIVAAHDNNYLGGLVGRAGGTIKRCYATGAVNGYSGANGSDYVGGLVGDLNSSLTDSFATGNVTGYTYVAGLVGDTGSSLTISNCYSTGVCSTGLCLSWWFGWIFGS